MEEITQILERVMELYGYKTEGAVAKAIGESISNFSNKKKTGTIKNKLLLHGVEKGARLEWLRTRQGEMLANSEVIALQADLLKVLKENILLREKLDRLTAPLAGADHDGG